MIETDSWIEVAARASSTAVAVVGWYGREKRCIRGHHDVRIVGIAGSGGTKYENAQSVEFRMNPLH
jgi:hypothetical protein